MQSDRGVPKDMVMRGIKELNQLNSLEEGSSDDVSNSGAIGTGSDRRFCYRRNKPQKTPTELLQKRVESAAQ